MGSLLGDGLPPLTISESDISVNRSLPAAKQKDNVVAPKDIKENQLKQGEEQRSIKQSLLKTDQIRLQDEESGRKKYIKGSWNSASDVKKQEFMNMISNYNLPEYKALIDYIKLERSWWKSRHSSGLPVSMLESFYSDYKDTLSDLTKVYEDALESKKTDDADLIERRSKAKGKTEDDKAGMEIDTNIDWDKIKSADVKGEEKPVSNEVDPFKRSMWDDVNESWGIIMGYLGIITWLVFGLRFASFTVNEYFYIKTPYKILVFLYTFLFTPAIFPYFIYKIILTWYNPVKYPHVIYRSFFPTYGYDPDKSPITVMDAWLGYKEDTSTLEYIQMMLKKEKDAKLDVLKSSTLLDDLKAELRKK